MKSHVNLCVLGLALGLAGCGGGGGDGGGAAAAPPGEAEVPASALTSVQSFSQFVGSLRASDRAEPLLLRDDTVPPASDADEPIPVS